MPVIYLKHREFGNKVAFSELEATYDKSNGWEEYHPEQKQEEDRENVVEMPAKRKYTRRQ